MEFAKTNIPYYRAFPSLKTLIDFPVVNKSVIKNNYNEFLSSRYYDRKVVKISTSGSTGTPFVVYQDSEKRSRNFADTIYFAGLANFKIGDKLFFFRLWAKELKKSRLQAFAQNLKMVNVLDFSDRYFEELIKNLEQDRSEKCFLGYVSAYIELCKYLDKNKQSV